MFIQNKYKFWHDNIIARAKKRQLSGYKERHHIIPKCLNGSDKKTNLVNLTAKEHFIVHMLLCKFTTDLIRKKMLCAFNAMCILYNNGRRYKITSRISQKLREDLAVYMREINLGKTLSPETIAKIKEYKHTDEHKQKIKDARKLQICTQETREKYSKIYSNLVWINKSGKSKRVTKEIVKEYLKKGYKLGRDTSYIDKAMRDKLSKKTTEYWNRKRVA